MHLFLVGAGHVGLVTAVGLAKLGHMLTVADIDAARIALLRGGHAPLFEPGLDDALRAAQAQGRLAFTTDPRPPADARFTIVAVSTPTGTDGPLSTANVEAVTRDLVAAAGPEHTIVIRSTLPVDGPDRLLAVCRESLRFKQKALGPEHSSVQFLRFELGRMQVEAGQTTEGLFEMQAAMEKLSKALPSDHPDLAAMRLWVASAHTLSQR